MITNKEIGMNGRFGNQLFQYASLCGIAKKNNYDYGVSYNLRSDNEKFHFCLSDCFDFLEAKDASNIQMDRYIRDNDWIFNPNFFNIPDGSDIWGYFQSEKYFLGVDISKEFILNINHTELLKRRYEKLFNKKTISLHYRLGGDRVNESMQLYHKNVSSDFYKNALDVIQYNPDEYNILVFSDNMNLCKELLRDLDYTFNFIQNENNVLDFIHMALCDINIVGNSTFSWWSAYMNQNKNKKVIVTESEWFGPGYKQFNLTDTFPESWIRL